MRVLVHALITVTISHELNDDSPPDASTHTGMLHVTITVTISHELNDDYRMTPPHSISFVGGLVSLFLNILGITSTK